MNRRCVLGFLSTVLIAFCLATAEAQVRDLGGELIPERTASGGLLVITAGQLVDPETGVTQSDQTIVIEDGIILEVGEDVTIPTGATPRFIRLNRFTRSHRLSHPSGGVI